MIEVLIKKENLVAQDAIKKLADIYYSRQSLEHRFY